MEFCEKNYHDSLRFLTREIDTNKHTSYFAKLQFLNDKIGVLAILPNFYIKLRLTQFLLALNIFSEVSTDRRHK